MFIHEITIEFTTHSHSYAYIVGDAACVYCIGEALTPAQHRLTCIRIHNYTLQSFEFHYTVHRCIAFCLFDILTYTLNRYYRKIFPDNSLECKKNK